MGQAKNALMEDESKGYRLPEEKYVCACHFNDRYLKQYIVEHSMLGTCDYCGKKKQVIDLRDFMEYAAEKIISSFGDPQDEGLYLVSSFQDDDDDDIPGMKCVSGYIAPSDSKSFEDTKDLLYHINLITNNEKLNNEIESCFFFDKWIQHAPYMMSKGQELSFMWEQFDCMVKHKQRFTFLKKIEFDGTKLSEDNGLMDILTEIGKEILEHNLCKKINKNKILYRCRFVDTEKEVIDKFEDMTSPPDESAKQNRMSPAGISMFYGAFDEETAALEGSPGGNGLGEYVMGEFKTKGDLNVLDLTNLPVPSFWAPSDWEGVIFLHAFSREITKSIIRDDRVHTAYVPSQVFTEYLRYIYKLSNGDNLDGMIYNSSICGGKNIVLFYNQSRSKEILDLVKIL